MCPTETTTFCISRAKTVMLNEECARNYSNAFVELVFSMNGEKFSDSFWHWMALFALSGVCAFGLSNAYMQLIIIHINGITEGAFISCILFGDERLLLLFRNTSQVLFKGLTATLHKPR